MKKLKVGEKENNNFIKQSEWILFNPILFKAPKFLHAPNKSSLGFGTEKEKQL